MSSWSNAAERRYQLQATTDFEAAIVELKERFGDKLSDPMWRICSGELYKITIKGDGSEESLVIPFIPNRVQMRFIKRMYHRNLILKARQRGFTTLIAILWLDHALWVANSRCGIIAHDREAAEVIFRDKVKFAYDNLPEVFKIAFPLARDSAIELLFAHNNSSVRVATSMRSGTIHRLHISEFGKICAKYPDKANEVITGSLPAVPMSGVAVIESTSEGDEGEFYEMTRRAMAQQEQNKPLTTKDFRFHFFAWWDDSPEYEVNPALVNVTENDHEYFNQVEEEMCCKLSPRQRAWYVATREADFSGSREKMWQEYPSSPGEAFKRSTEGCYYAHEMTMLRTKGRILNIPETQVPVDTFWDIGNSDGCAIWFHQTVGMEDRFLSYYEGHGLNLKQYMKVLQDSGYLFGKHYLPHDAGNKPLSDTNKSVIEQLEGLGLKNIIRVPRISDINTGIQITRSHFASAYFDEKGCEVGLRRLNNYKKKWDSRQGRYNESTPEKNDGNSEGADAFRQYAQAKDAGLINNQVSKGPYDANDKPDWF